MIRPTNKNDVHEVMKILEECKDEIPLSQNFFTDGKLAERREIISGFCTHEKSIVSIDQNNQIVGFALVKDHYPDILQLEYIAVKRASRKNGIFTSLMQKLQSCNLTLRTTVCRDNTSQMIAILTKSNFANDGFIRKPSNDWEQILIWNPSSVSA